MNIRLLWSCLINCNYFKSILQDLLIQPLLFPLLLLLLLLLFPKTTTCNYPIAIINKISIWYHNIYNLFNFIFIIITISNNVVNTVIIIILIPIFITIFTINFSFFVLLFFITVFLACLSFLFVCVCMCMCVCVCVFYDLCLELFKVYLTSHFFRDFDLNWFITSYQEEPWNMGGWEGGVGWGRGYETFYVYIDGSWNIFQNFWLATKYLLCSIFVILYF